MNRGQRAQDRCDIFVDVYLAANSRRSPSAESGIVATKNRLIVSPQFVAEKWPGDTSVQAILITVEMAIETHSVCTCRKASDFEQSFSVMNAARRGEAANLLISKAGFRSSVARDLHVVDARARVRR